MSITLSTRQPLPAAPGKTGGAGPISVAAPADDNNQSTGLAALRKDNRNTWLLFIAASAAVVVGWHGRGENYLTAESGIGYWLGIIGGSLMLLLLIYPLRKRCRWLQLIGPVKHWFRAHMFMGLAGPVCILYHCNFQFGSTNSNVALISMLMVAGSGLVGRFLYTKIHYGLYGHKANLIELCSDTRLARSRLNMVFLMAPGVRHDLLRLDKAVTQPAEGFIKSTLRLPFYVVATRWARWKSRFVLLRVYRVAARRYHWSSSERRQHYKEARQYIADYLALIRRVAEFTFYERLFALWHVLHLPLFFMLLMAGVGHVVAVHMY